jgi:hypothetical protein
MRAAVVLRDHFDVPVLTASVELVLDADVGKVHALVEIRQIVFARPSLDLARIPIRPTVAVGALAIARLQELLVLALELALHDDVPHVCAAFAKLAGRLSIRVLNARVVRQFAAIDTVTVPVAALVVAVTAVHLQEFATAVRQDDGAVTLVERYGRDEAFVAQVVKAIGSWVEQVAVRHDAKRAHGGETATVVAVQFVRLFTIPDDFPLQAARQIETVQQDVARVVRDAVACLPPVITLQLKLVAVAALARIVAADR